MSEQIHEGSSRPRTVSRLRFVAPPGMALEETDRKTIGRYEIIKTLGRGAMGVVYKARDPLLDRIVAVKTIVSPQGVGKRVRSAYLERFEREAKAAAKMQHPAIVTIFDVGVDEDLGAPFMVLEYLPGESLADRLDRVRMPLGRGVQIALDLASALAFAHRQRIVHRDVKPANVLHAGEGRWKLADFGIARLPDSDLTQVGIFMGTPGYSPPEAIREGRYTPQADVFAWGAVLYEVLSGHIPYEGPDTRTTNSHVVRGEASPPTKHDSSIPAPLSAVTMTALNPSSTDRYRDAADAEAALRKAWDYCLTHNLVLPSSLTGEELPHERVGGEMHSRYTNPSGGSVSTGGSGSFDASATQPDPKPAFVIEPRGKERDRVSDDDPTRILVRDREDKSDRTIDMKGQKSGPVVADRSVKQRVAPPQDGTPVVATRSSGGAVTSSRNAPTPRWVWVMVVIAALGAGGAAAWLILSSL
jgi:serine/threonine protein kinase